MSTFAELCRRIFHLPKRSEFGEELGVEMQHHLELKTEENIRAGMSAQEARYAALREFGNVTLLNERSRAAWSLRWAEELGQDVRYGFRILRKAPVFTAVAVLTLALGIGANTAIFSIVNAVLIRSLPVSRPGQLVFVRWISKKWPKAVKSLNGGADTDASGISSTSLSYPAYEALSSRKDIFSDLMGVFDASGITSVIEGDASICTVEEVTGNFFSALGVAPVLGRTLQPADDILGIGGVAVVSHSVWQREFGSSSAVVGKQVLLNGAPYTIVGVAPEDFNGVRPGRAPDYWTPLHTRPGVNATAFVNHDRWWLRVIGRLQPGVKQNQARAALDIVLTQEAAATVGAAAPAPAEQVPHIELLSGSRGLDELRNRLFAPLRILLVVVLLVLFLACANVANLMLVRGAARTAEIAMRRTLGASRGRLIRQLVVESFALALLGGAAGLVVGSWGRSILLGMITSQDKTIRLNAALDWRVLAFTIAISVLTVLVFGLAPSFRASRAELVPSLNGGHALKAGARISRFGTRNWLVAVQAGVSLVLVFVAALFIRTLVNLGNENLGFNPQNVLLFSVNPGNGGYKGARLDSFYQDLMARLRSTAGVESVAASQITLISDSMNGYPVKEAEGAPNPVPVDRSMMAFNYVSPDFFKTMKISVIAGREISDADTTGAPLVALINQTAARNLFGEQNPIGRWVGFNPALGGATRLTIVGLAGDAKFTGVSDKAPATLYLSYRQALTAAGEMSFEVRSSLPEKSLVPVIRDLVKSLAPTLPVYGVTTQQLQIDNSVSQQRMFARLTGFFGLATLLLVAVGLYGVLGFSVEQRRREIGVRMALGAQRSNVIRMILREGLGGVLVGIAAGLIGALAAGRMVHAFVYGVHPRDPISIAIATLLLLSTGVIAAYLPARRAVRVDPMVALRHE